MRILYAYNYHRGGNGSLHATARTVRLMRAHGLHIEEFTRDSRDLEQNLWGRLTAAASAFYAPEAVKAFRKMLDTFKPDVVHVYDVFPLISPWIFPLCARRNTPVVMTCDDYFLTCPNRNHFRDGKICVKCLGGHEYYAIVHNCRKNLAESISVSMYSSMLRMLKLVTNYVSRLIVSSEFTGRWMAEQSGIPASRIDLVAHSIDIPDTVADPGTGKYVAFGARFVPEKGIDTFLEASRICHLPFRLSRNEGFFVNVDLPPDAEIVVTKGRNDLEDFYRSARMLAIPGKWFETFGLVGAEAMSLGIPVVGSNIGAIANLIEDGVDGLLFEPDNPGDLAAKVTRLWNDIELCRRLGRNGRAKALRLWNPQSHVNGLVAAYSRAIDDAKAATRQSNKRS
jgi:glycosyltransferase involved in cell wall biosynthesis